MVNYLLKISRLEALTDGIFAVAMTILILDLRLPPGHEILMSSIYLKLLIYAASFLILGTLWIAMNFQLGMVEHVSRTYLWCNLFYLMVICVVPFSANFVATHPTNQISLTFYAVNLLCTSVGQILTCECARIYKLNSSRFTEAFRWAVLRRIFVAPPFYILSIFLAPIDPLYAFIALILPPIVYMLPGKVDKFDKKPREAN